MSCLVETSLLRSRFWLRDVTSLKTAAKKMLGKGIHKGEEESEQCRNLLYSKDHFHQDHNAPCLPSKFGINIVFSWGDCNIKEKSGTIIIKNLGGGGGEKQGALWSRCKW